MTLKSSVLKPSGMLAIVSAFTESGIEANPIRLRLFAGCFATGSPFPRFRVMTPDYISANNGQSEHGCVTADGIIFECTSSIHQLSECLREEKSAKESHNPYLKP